MTSPIASVVIPCHNVEPFLDECLAAARSASDGDLQLICVDDGSTDETAAVLSRAKSVDPLLVAISQPQSGASAARNAGLAVVTSPYVQFLDADDLLLAGKIDRQVSMLEGTNHDLVAGAARRETLDGHVQAEVIVCDEDPFVALAKSRLGITSSNLFRASTVRAVGGWDESLRSSQETDLMFRMLAHGSSVVLDSEVATVIRSRPGSISRQDLLGNARRRIDLRTRILEHVESSGSAPAVVQQVMDALHDEIAAIAIDAPQLAIDYHRVLDDLNFVPSVGENGRTRPRVELHRLLGFERMQQIRRLRRKNRDTHRESEVA